jgi:hypothetical protein
LLTYQVLQNFLLRHRVVCFLDCPNLWLSHAIHLLIPYGLLLLAGFIAS